MKEAKDTVRLCPRTPQGWRINCDDRCHEGQAEISFKAGQRQVAEEILEIVKDYSAMNFGEYSKKYGVEKGKWLGDEIKAVLKSQYGVK